MKCRCNCGGDTPIADRTDSRRNEVRGQPKEYIPGHKISNRNAHLVGRVAELIENSGIDVDEISKIQRINLYQGFYKDAEGEAHVQDMAALQLTPTWADGPEWPVVQPAAPTVVKYSGKLRSPSSVRTTVILPDPQIGYWRISDGSMVDIHDEDAMTAALRVIHEVNPHYILNLGDFLDMSEWTLKFAVYPEFSYTTQAALDRGHRFLAEQRAAASEDVEIGLIAGNHEDRLSRAILQNAKSALRLRRADEPEGWPVMSIPNLLALDTVDVDYIGAYPAGRVKLAEAHGRQTALIALHGEKLDMVKQAKAERQSTVQGHTHHVSTHSEVYEQDGEPVEVESWSLGCLCKIDGSVPSTKGAPDVYGRPVKRHESWSQAVGVLTESDSGWSLEVVRIRDGVAFLRGKEV